jgi:hypothetical protein
MAKRLKVLTEDDLGSDPDLDGTVWAVIADHLERTGRPMPLEDLFSLMKGIDRPDDGGKIVQPDVKWSLYRLYYEGLVKFGGASAGQGWDNKQKSMALRGRSGPGKDAFITTVTVANPSYRPADHTIDQNYAKGPVPNKPGAIPPKRWDQPIEKLIEMGAPLTVAYGVGVDSTAMLVEFVRLGIRPELILFADVGAEKPETYDYIPIMQRYLKKHGFPQIVTVRYKMTEAGLAGRKVKAKAKEKPLDPREYKTITENMIYNRTLPSLAYGFRDHSCSSKWKVGPQLDYIANGAFAKRAKKAWDAGLPVIRAIGFDASDGDRGRRDRIPDDARYMHWYPLQDWGWDRERCKQEIRKAGLPVPLKSACFFCPSTHPWEIQRFVLLDDPFVDKLRQMEDLSRPYNRQGPHQGLWWTGDKLPAPVRDQHPYGSEYWFESGKLTPAEMDYFIKVKWGGLPPYENKKGKRANIGRPGTKPGRISDFVEVFKRFCKQKPESPQCSLASIEATVGGGARVKQNPVAEPLGPDPYSYSSEGKPVTYHDNPVWSVDPDPEPISLNPTRRPNNWIRRGCQR